MHIAIIGNGISGITAARHIRKNSDHRISVISAETEYFFSRTALMYVYMGHMKFEHIKPYEDWFWKKNRIDLVFNHVEKVDKGAKTLFFSDKSELTYDKLIIATGSQPNKFGWPGQDLEGVQGMYSYQDLQRMEERSPGIEHAVIVGGGLIGIEMAEMFHSRHIPVTFLVRENSFWNGVLPLGESAMINREILGNGIDLRLETELKEILPDDKGKVRAVTTNKGEDIPCQFVGLTAGVHPNIGFLEGSGIETKKGVLVNEHFETNVPDVYAVGDCAQFQEPPSGRKPVEQVWYTGRMHGEVVAQVICGKKIPYKPGPWFNSAKFFDIEYQTYGMVPAKIPSEQQSLYWEHSDGRRALHIVYEAEGGKVQGFNLMNIRFRHEVCDQWLKEGRDIRYVLEHLPEANFDPEFFKTYEQELVGLYNKQQPDKPVNMRKKRRLFEWF